MTVIVTCQCGKQFRAADEHAGMEAKCPACQRPLTIPGSRRAEPPPPPLLASASASPKILSSKRRFLPFVLGMMMLTALIAASVVAYSFIKSRKTKRSQRSELVGKLVFLAEDSHDLSLWAMNPDGSEKTRLLPTRLFDHEDIDDIAISADGTKIAIPDPGDADIAVIDIEEDKETGFVFPGKSRLAFQKFEIKHLRWSPDGTSLAFEATGVAASSNIYVLEIGTGDVIPLTMSNDESVENYYPAWTASGEKVMFERCDFGKIDEDERPRWETYLVPANGQGEEQLVESPVTASHVAFSPDGTKIAFCGPGAELYVGKMENGRVADVSQLTNNLGKERMGPSHIRWSPDGTTIAFSDSSYSSTIRLINAGGGNLRGIPLATCCRLVAWLESPSFMESVADGETNAHQERTRERAPTPIAPEDLEPNAVMPTPKLSADPLPNGVVFDDTLSVAVAKVERKEDAATIWLACRKLREDGACGLVPLRLTDDRGNEYEEQVIVSPGLVHSEILPTGFTWVQVTYLTIPQIAPVAKIELGGRRLDSRTLAFPSFECDVPAEKVLSPPTTIQIDKNLSVRFRPVTVRAKEYSIYSDAPKVGFFFSWRMEIENRDYHPHTFGGTGGVSAQLDDGRMIACEGSEELEVGPLSVKECEIRADIPFEDREGKLSKPRMFIFNEQYRSYRFLAIPPEIKAQCMEIERNYYVLKKARPLLDKWCEKHCPRLSSRSLWRVVPADRFSDCAVVANQIWLTVQKTGGSAGPLIHSPDGGRTWRIEWEDDGTHWGYPPSYPMVHFFDETTGLLITGYDLLRTTDGGKTWDTFFTVRNLPNLPNMLGSYQIGVIDIRDRRSILVNDDLQTVDGGATWVLHYDGGPFGKVDVRSIDAGKTWTSVGSESPPAKPEASMVNRSKR